MRASHDQAEVLELVLGNPAHGGACVARDGDGMVVFVRGGIPGERVRARVTAKQSRLKWAIVEEVLESSPERVESLDVEGMDLSHLNLPAQRQWKTQVLGEQLRRVGGAEVARQVKELYPRGVEVKPLPGDETDALVGRRTRSRFSITKSRHLGMRRYRTHDLVEAPDHPLLPDVFAGVFSSPEWRSKWKPGEEITLLAPTASAPVVVSKREVWDLAGNPVSPLVQWNVDGKIFTTDARGFWQVHPGAPEALVAAVLKQGQFQDGERVIELYSGAGLFSYFIAEAIGAGGKLATVEQDPGAVAAAADNLGPLGLSETVSFYEGDVDAEAIAALDQEMDGALDKVVLDPPRAGAGKAVLAAIDASSASQVTIIACDPAAGARDIGYLVEAGWSVEAVESFDLFPQTHHFETVATLRRGGYRGN